MNPCGSPKRKSASEGSDNDERAKRLRSSDSYDDNNEKNTKSAEEMVVDPPMDTSNGDGVASEAAAPDSLIDHAAAIAYWSSTSADDTGVLGGFPQVSRVDLQGSSNFLAKLVRRREKAKRAGAQHQTTDGKQLLSRAVDCGAGIGRITRGFLSRVAEVVDIVEPVPSFTAQIAGHERVGEIYNVGLESWTAQHKYDVIWNQWCVGQLTDAQLCAYLRHLPDALLPGGWIVVKENISNHHLGEDVFDETDSSVTRTDAKFRRLFEDAGLQIVATELQKGMPKELYEVRSYALQEK